jgi:hypothetical protein
MASVAQSPVFSERPAALVATAQLALAEPDWPRFRSVLADVARQGGWSLRDGSQSSALGGSLSGDDTQVAYKQWAWADPPETRATLYVVAAGGGEGWRGAVEALFHRLAREWPGALTVRD